MIRLLVIADDLTGALDTGVQMAKRGIKTLVLPWEQVSGGFDGQYQVLVADTESRHLEGAEAFRRVQTLVRRAEALGVPHLYKKTDSTLRGNIGAELAAMLPAEAACLMFAPAFPRLLRTTRDGLQYVDGVPLAQTDFARDPIDPVRSSAVGEIIGEQCALPVINCRTDNYEEAAARTCAESTIVVADAESTEHLRELGRILKRHGRTRYLAGCAGFAEVLPEMLHLDAASPAKPVPSKGGVLVVCGSVNQRSLEQVAGAARRGHSVFPLTQEQKQSESYPDSDSCEEFARRVEAAVAATGAAVLSAVKDASEVTRGAGTDSLLIAGRLGRITARVLEAAEIETLVVFGGDTLLAITAAVGGDGIVPVDELFPGVVMARLYRRDGTGLNLVTKAGGFGESDVLERILVFLQK